MGSCKSQPIVPINDEKNENYFKKETEKTATDDFPRMGVQLSYLKEFCQMCQDKNRTEEATKAWEEMTTDDVCKFFVKPMTEPDQSSLCEYLESKAHPAVQEAEVFISHAWKYTFVNVVNAIFYHFRDKPDIIIWFDLFSNNQHKAISKPFEFWQNTFKNAIKKMGYTVMVLNPWNNPIPYTRAWCVFEAYATADTNSTFEIAMSEADQKQFIEDMEGDPQEVLQKMIASIDAKRSECFKPADKDRIFDAIKKTVGFDKINSMLHAQLRGWVIAVGKAFLKAARATDDGKRQAALMFILATTYRLQGEYQNAQTLFEECFQQRKAVLGGKDRDTLTAMDGLDNLYEDHGEYTEAQPLHEECLAQQKASLGKGHPHTLNSMNNLANLYADQGSTPKPSRCTRNAWHNERHRSERDIRIHWTQ